MQKVVVFFLGFLLITACSDDYGHRIEGKNITVYFEAESDLQPAKELAQFWKRNDFVGKRPQYVKLIQKKKAYHLYLIRTESLKNNSLPFFEQKQLLELQELLNDSLHFSKPIELVISNKRFEPVLKLN